MLLSFPNYFWKFLLRNESVLNPVSKLQSDYLNHEVKSFDKIDKHILKLKV